VAVVWAARDQKNADVSARCGWVQPADDALYCAYHDTEWGVPERDARASWEKLVLDGFRAGLAWITILRKRDTLRAGFADFDPARVARFSEADIARLLADPGVIGSRAKIEAAIASARLFLDMQGARRRFQRVSVGICGWRADPKQLALLPRGANRHADLRAPVERSETPRCQIRWSHDRLCLHAGGGHGQ
jgi:3-methyladenine DNA glycosylase Tag